MTEHVDRGLAVEELQEEVRDPLGLTVVGDHVRMLLVGDEVAELDEWAADAVPQGRALAGEVAIHVAALAAAPDRRVRSLAKVALHWAPEAWLRSDEAGRRVADRVGAPAGWACSRKSQATDPQAVHVLDAPTDQLKGRRSS